ncbi:glycoside hydrolase, family 5 [Artemisia annua]|uniref:Glycoside hydrolase, family 5 n=1 Tax=Artemisia annua TaxID=35608 RepID=A0A2U1KYZ2_ARTAN|nr:glycoside hydrolase, family 5 [Artemisia annua]
MCMASDPTTKTKVTDAFQQASKIGMNVVRTWAFSDGGNKPIQISHGIYYEDTFKVKCLLKVEMSLFVVEDKFGNIR